MNKEKIIIAISGGVDSAVAALLLKEKGCELIGVHMQNWDAQVNNENIDSKEKGCTSKEDLKFAKKVAKDLGIELKIYNFVSEYWENVFQPFLDLINENLISNPDVFCNSKIKFGILLERIKKDFGDNVKIATGHYAKVVFENKKYYLGVSNNLRKDQTYFLSRLSEEQLKYIVFPLGEFSTKEEIRDIAKKNNLNNWFKKDSTGICFIGKRNFQEFLKNYLKFIPGDVFDIETNQKIGKHDGLNLYVLHQRFGSSVSGYDEKYYVCKKDHKKNNLYLCKKSQINKYLFSSKSKLINIFWINNVEPNLGDSLYIKAKHGNVFIKVKIIEIKKEFLKIQYLKCFLTNPGQFLVFYSLDKRICLGSGILISSE